MSESVDNGALTRSDEKVRVRYRPGPDGPQFLPMHGRIFLAGEEVDLPAYSQVERGGAVLDLRRWFSDRSDFEVIE